MSEVAQEQGNTEQGENLDTQPAVEPSADGQQAAEKPADSEAQAPASEKKEEGGLLSKVEEKKEEAPEKYDEFKGDFLDESANTDLASLAKEQQLTQTQANTLADGYSAAMKSLADANQKSVEENHKAFSDDQQGKENVLLAQKSLDHLGITEHFKANGYDNDYTLIKALAEHGRMLSEDKVVTGATSSPAAPQSPYSSEWK